MKRDRTGNLAFSIFIRNTLCKALLFIQLSNHRSRLSPSKKKKTMGTHFCEDCDRSKGVAEVYSYDRLQGWYFYRVLRAAVQDLSI